MVRLKLARVVGSTCLQQNSFVRSVVDSAIAGTVSRLDREYGQLTIRQIWRSIRRGSRQLCP